MENPYLPKEYKERMEKTIYAQCDEDFKKNGCINVWSADYPDIKKEVYTFHNNINCLSCRMEIYRVAKKIEDRVRARNSELPFKVHIIVSKNDPR